MKKLAETVLIIGLALIVIWLVASCVDSMGLVKR